MKQLFDEMAAVLAGGQGEARQEAAEVFAFLEMDRAAVNLGDVADDGEAKAGARLAGGVEPGAAA